MIPLLFSLSASAMPLVLVETDPSTFAFKGYALHARVALPNTPWVLGAGSYAMDMPQVVTQLSPENRGEAWALRLQPSVGLWVDRFRNEEAQGLHLGMQLATHSWRTKDGEGGDAQVQRTVMAMPRVGTHWVPREDLGLYVAPWVGLGVTATLQGGEYAQPRLLPFGAVHVGWRFGG